jgi:hypothetical protein
LKTAETRVDPTGEVQKDASEAGVGRVVRPREEPAMYRKRFRAAGEVFGTVISSSCSCRRLICKKIEYTRSTRKRKTNKFKEAL